MDPIVYFLVGLPGSGKSTWRQAYFASSSYPTTVISSDDLIEKYAAENDMTYSEAFHEVDFNKITQSLMVKFRNALANNQNIIIDRMNLTPKVRKQFLRLIPPSYKKKAIVFNVPKDELQKRLTHRSITTGKHISNDVIDTMAKSYKEPTIDEFDEIEKI